MSKTTMVRITLEDKEKLVLLSQRFKLNQGEVVGFLCDEAFKHDMTSEDWVDKIIDLRFGELVLKHDFQMRKEYELIKFKSIIRLKESMIKTKLNKMDNDQAIEFIDQLLGNPDGGGNILDRITSQQIYVVNGENKSFEPDPDGKPRMVGIPPSHILRCETGYHTKLDDCRACNYRNTCEVRKAPIIDWLAVHGSHEQREGFLETGRFEFKKEKKNDSKT